MPHKRNIAGRHHIPKMRHVVTNWRGYEAWFRLRGSLKLCVSDEAIAGWAAMASLNAEWPSQLFRQRHPGLPA